MDLLFEVRVGRVHNGYIGIVSCFPGLCTSKLFIKCVGCFPVFLVKVKRQFSKVFVMDACSQTVSHELLKGVRHLRIFGLLGSASDPGFEICYGLLRFLCAVEKS